MTSRPRHMLIPLALAAALFALGAAAPMKKGADAAKIKRGEYLATVMGCGDCHTPGMLFGQPDVSRALSGSELGWQGPWGVSYPRNLTPDPETGLGKWTEAQIVTAIRTGVRPDKRILNPPMPWQDFSKLTDADAHALAAYLMSLPPVKHQAPDLVPPGKKVEGSIIVMPPPPAWDVPAAAK